MFKQAFVRGIQCALINSDTIAFPDEAVATKIADHIADVVDIDITKAVPAATSRKIAEKLVAASEWFKTNQPGYKAAAFTKLATWNDVRAYADYHAEALMNKAAEGSTIEGGDKGNNEPTTGEAKMDMHQRPVGYAANSLGKTDVDTRPGTVGKELPQPAPPHTSPSGSNSLTEHSRTASVVDIFRKAAEGSTIEGGDKGNSEPTTGEAKMDMHQRPVGYAVLPHQGAPGAIPAMVGGSAIVGKETTHPNGPSLSPGGSNSVTAHSAKAAEASDPYLTLFKKTANEVGPYIPSDLPEDVRVAAVRACMGMTLNERARYLGQLQYDAKTAAQASTQGGRQRKAAEEGGLPAFLRDKKDEDTREEKDEGGLPAFLRDKKDDDKKDDDKKDDDKKEAAVRANVARINAALRGMA